MTFVNQANTKHRPGGAYSNVIAKIGQDGVCPFCPENLAKYHPNPIIRAGGFWLLTKNAYPYEGAAHHFLLIHKAHIESFEQLTPAAWAELQTLLNFVLTDNAIKGAALAFRFGDTAFTGASVAHLHAQLIAGSGATDAKPVLMRVG
ncbi:MAG TPA: hypothetical protein VLG40_00430 [Candidatus Saccharimonas sp.]|nr:hypothetical protein [Candidatus Saccharimonas sp.]